MKSLLKRIIHTALGAADAGKHAAEKLAARLAQKAGLSEKKGAMLTKRLRERTSKAVRKLEKQFAVEIDKAVQILHQKTHAEVRLLSRSPGRRVRSANKKAYRP